MITEEVILQALKRVKDPEKQQDIVSLGMVQNVQVSGGSVSLTLLFATPAGPVRAQLEKSVRELLGKIPAVTSVNLTTSLKIQGPQTPPPPGPRNVVAIASGKGGVGKSTVSVNLAVALARDGAKVGLLDADIYGPNIPLMMGLEQLPPLQDGKIVPAENFGVKVMSMGFLVKPTEAVIWRGPMLHGAITKFMKEVLWGELDYLLVDLPPGTGDVQLSLSQVIALNGALVVTTPQDVALQDVQRAVSMFEKVKVPVLGVVENMSTFVCPHCAKATEIFDHGGGARAAEAFKVPFLGEIPLVVEVRAGADSGHPVVLTHPDSPASVAFTQISRKLVEQVKTLSAAQPKAASAWTV